MRTAGFLSALLPVLLCAACSGDRIPAPGAPGSGKGGATAQAQGQTATGGAGGGSLRIEPDDVYRGMKVQISASTPVPPGATVDWIVGGKVVQSGDSLILDTSSLRKGDTIQAHARLDGRTAASQTISIRNSPPEIRGIRFVQGDGGGGGQFGIETESYDADGEEVRLLISWRKNGLPAGEGNRPAAPVKRGDKLDVTVTPFDEEGPGKSATLFREVRNAPPIIEGHDQFQADDNVVTFRIRASDPDGDALAFTLKDAPAGMQIDKGTGRVRWETAPGTTGKVPFSVSASDGAGGEANARITVTITAQPRPGARQ